MHDTMPKLWEIEMANEERWYEVTFKQVQPIHIGDNKHGVINETKIFIPGQTMWGALTNAYFKQTYNYDEKFFENISCFYPKISNNVLKPRYENGKFYLGEYSETKFRQKFTTTFLSTAINPTTLHAKDESLHEIDVVLPNEIPQEEQFEQIKEIFWIGYIKTKKEQLEQIKEIYIGGDSRYGLGLMELIGEPKESRNYTQNPVKGIIKEYSPNEPLTNFLEFNNQNFEGELELFAEFDFSENLPKVIDAKYCISVGSIIK